MPNLSKSSFNRITHKEIRWRPYRIQKRHALQRGDHQRRLNYCNWLVNRHHRFTVDIIIGDEACFHMNGQVNIWNTRKYGQDRNAAHDFVHDISNDMRKVNVWVGLAGDNTILGPIFLDGNITGQVYLDMINQQVVPQLHQRYGRQRNGAIRRKWRFQDGAPAHRIVIVRDRLQELFPNRVVGLGHQLEWPLRSPDLTPLDFFLWGYLKQKVYRTDPANLADLQNRITREVQALRRTRMGRRAVQGMVRRARRCIELDGGQVEGRAGLPWHSENILNEVCGAAGSCGDNEWWFVMIFQMLEWLSVDSDVHNIHSLVSIITLILCAKIRFLFNFIVPKRLLI